ncbi:MAG TPA: glycosyltransferase [Candidatus Eisenbacteria bacterium]|nr:glycosyltransferase [Candidatus Eisenbacteria bacterium]
MSAVVVVVPCYNEAHRLEGEKFKAFAPRFPMKFLFVNDGSQDDTLRVLEQLRQLDPARFAIHNLPQNVGKAEAVRAGISSGIEADTVYAGYWDADLATPLDALVDFYDLLESRPDLDLVIGSRVRLLGRSIERSAVRHYLGRVFATAASLCLGLPVYDTQCGAKLMRAGSAKALFEEPFLTRWLFDVEIIARMIRDRGTTETARAIFEFPLFEWEDVAGSKVRPQEFFRAFSQLARIYRHYLK